MDKPSEKQYGHGNHWNAVLMKENQLPALLVKAINTDVDDTVLVGISPYIGLLGFKPPVRVLSLLKREDKEKRIALWSAYPLLQVNNPIEVTLKGIEEWPNGVEAVLIGSTEHGADLSFFDTLYFQNKNKYKVGSTYVFHIAAIAYGLIKRPKEQEMIVIEDGPSKEEHSTKGVTAYFFDDTYTDDFSFMNPFSGFGETHSFNGVKMREFTFFLKALGEEKDPITFPMYIRNDLLDQYEPKEGDDVNGTGWLTGYLDGSLNRTK